jgi:Double zinc ribbon
VSASVFGGVHSFLHSGSWAAVRFAIVAFVGLFWLATVYWVLKDARRRIEDWRLVSLATLVGAVPPFFGPLVYMLFRPPEYLEDVRERELEIKAIETRLGGADLRCKVCGCDIDSDFLVCPVCTTRLRAACESCSRPLEPAWQVCPYCETPVPLDSTVALAEAKRAAPRRTRS